MKELLAIQLGLKAPKGQYNSFGKYKYRSCEDILEAVKPLLGEHSCTLTIQDEMIQVGERYYVRATVTLKNNDGESVSTTAFAREAERKTGMDESQITGTASSYARKYALNGLFCIDDTKDTDSDINGKAPNTNSSKQGAPDPIATAQPIQPKPKKRVTMDMLEDDIKCDCLLDWGYKLWTTSGYDENFDLGARLLKSYDAEPDVVKRYVALFNSYKVARMAPTNK